MRRYGAPQRAQLAANHARQVLEALRGLRMRLEALPVAARDSLEAIQAEPSIPDDLLTEWPVPPERWV